MVRCASARDGAERERRQPGLAGGSESEGGSGEIVCAKEIIS